jgi:BASS family bile acid:Na+ symporter
MNFLEFLGRHATVFMASSVFVALILPDLASVFNPLLTPVIWGMLFLAMVRLDWLTVKLSIGRWRVSSIALLWMLIGSPALMWACVMHLDVTPGIAIAMVLMASSAPLNSVPAIVMMMGLNGALALVVMIGATFLLPITMPVIAFEFMNIRLDMSAWEMAGRLTALLVSALIASISCRQFIGTERITNWKIKFDGVVVILLAIFAIAIMDGVSALLIKDPIRILTITFLSFVANALLQLIGFGLFKSIGLRDAMTFGFASGNRNMGIILAVLPASSDPDIMLYFALAQFPMYVYPGLLKPLIRKWVVP